MSKHGTTNSHLPALILQWVFGGLLAALALAIGVQGVVFGIPVFIIAGVVFLVGAIALMPLPFIRKNIRLRSWIFVIIAVTAFLIGAVLLVADYMREMGPSSEPSVSETVSGSASESGAESQGEPDESGDKSQAEQGESGEESQSGAGGSWDKAAGKKSGMQSGSFSFPASSPWASAATSDLPQKYKEYLDKITKSPEEQDDSSFSKRAASAWQSYLDSWQKRKSEGKRGGKASEPPADYYDD